MASASAKRRLYGSEIFAVSRSSAAGHARPRAGPAVSPAEETVRLLAEGKTFEEIAAIRVRQVATVVTMVADLIEKGRVEYRIEWVGEENHRRIEEAIGRLGSQWLKPLHEALPGRATITSCLVAAYVRRRDSRGGMGSGALRTLHQFDARRDLLARDQGPTSRPRSGVRRAAVAEAGGAGWTVEEPGESARA